MTLNKEALFLFMITHCFRGDSTFNMRYHSTWAVVWDFRVIPRGPLPNGADGAAEQACRRWIEQCAGRRRVWRSEEAQGACGGMRDGSSGEQGNRTGAAQYNVAKLLDAKLLWNYSTDKLTLNIHWRQCCCNR